MPSELTRARGLKVLHDLWGYNPEQARQAPAWVLRMSSILAMGEDVGQDMNYG